MISDVKILGDQSGERGKMLSEEALHFIGMLHRNFEPERERLLDRRARFADELSRGATLGLLPETEWIRVSNWKVPGAPFDLRDRRVEITGPTDTKMMINALNSGAKVFMADFEESHSSTWESVIDGQINLRAAVERKLQFKGPDGRECKLRPDIATLMVRPRGWHLQEPNLRIDDKQISASLFDFGIYFFHNAHALHSRGSGPYFYLPKLEGYLEARLWNEMFLYAQKYMGLPRGTVRATAMIETHLAAFEMEEILYELREHASGLSAGGAPFMRGYTKALVEVCHKHGAQAIGAMATFIPAHEGDGFDGTWVAHPDLVLAALKADKEVQRKQGFLRPAGSLPRTPTAN